MKPEVRFPMSEAARRVTVTVTVTGMRWWKIRARAGVALIRLGVWLSGFGFELRQQS